MTTEPRSPQNRTLSSREVAFPGSNQPGGELVSYQHLFCGFLTRNGSEGREARTDATLVSISEERNVLLPLAKQWTYLQQGCGEAYSMPRSAEHQPRSRKKGRVSGRQGPCRGQPGGRGHPGAFLLPPLAWRPREGPRPRQCSCGHGKGRRLQPRSHCALVPIPAAGFILGSLPRKAPVTPCS